MDVLHPGPLPLDQEPDNAAWISSDEFRMYHFKISLCAKRFNHDWNFCPYAHTGERACRRDPQRYNYTSITCLDMLQKGKCPRGDACTAAHSVFEYWLHPHRYRTEMCKVGAGCNRRICFFAHKPEELRPLPEHLANTCMPDGTIAGKYSLSAALPAGARGKDSQQQQQQQSGKLPADAGQQQDSIMAQKERHGASGAAGFAYGISSSSSSSTSIVNLSSSMLGSNNGSNNNSPSAAGANWLMSGRDDAQAAAVLGVDGLSHLGPAGGVATSRTLVGPVTIAANSAPQMLYSTAGMTMGATRPPRMPPIGSGPTAYPAAWPHMPEAAAAVAGGSSMQAGGPLAVVQAGGMNLAGRQQLVMLNMQQQTGLSVSNGLSLQLQQLNLADIGAPAAAPVANTTGFVTLPGMQACDLVFTGGNWQAQQQPQVIQVGMPIGQQQQHQQLTAAPVAAVSAGTIAAVTPQAVPVAADPQQQLLFQGQACGPGVLAHTAAMCGGGLHGSPYQQQQQLNFLQHGPMLAAEGAWHA